MLSALRRTKLAGHPARSGLASRRGGLTHAGIPISLYMCVYMYITQYNIILNMNYILLRVYTYLMLGIDMIGLYFCTAYCRLCSADRPLKLAICPAWGIFALH